MYRDTLNTRDRAATILLVILVHAGLAVAMLDLSGHLDLIDPQRALKIVDINSDPPPPPIVQVEQPKPKPKEDEGAASAANIKSHATPVVRPKPEIVVPTKPTIVATPTPNTGAEATQGASNVVGPGTGAGGIGTGTGSGGAGNGSGGGGQGSNPAVLHGLTRRDYPDSVQRAWPRGGAVFVAIRVHPDGHASDCRVDRSIGIPAIDAWTCTLLVERGRFKPATDGNGKPITSWYGYIQRDTGRFE